MSERLLGLLETRSDVCTADIVADLRLHHPRAVADSLLLVLRPLDLIADLPASYEDLPPLPLPESISFNYVDVWTGLQKLPGQRPAPIEALRREWRQDCEIAREYAIGELMNRSHRVGRASRMTSPYVSRQDRHKAARQDAEEWLHAWGSARRKRSDPPNLPPYCVQALESAFAQLAASEWFGFCSVVQRHERQLAYYVRRRARHLTGPSLELLPPNRSFRAAYELGGSECVDYARLARLPGILTNLIEHVTTAVGWGKARSLLLRALGSLGPETLWPVEPPHGQTSFLVASERQASDQETPQQQLDPPHVDPPLFAPPRRSEAEAEADLDALFGFGPVPAPAPEDLLEVRIEELDLSIRARRHLDNLKIRTVGELIQHSEAALLSETVLTDLRQALVQARSTIANQVLELLGLKLATPGNEETPQPQASPIRPVSSESSPPATPFDAMASAPKTETPEQAEPAGEEPNVSIPARIFLHDLMFGRLDPLVHYTESELLDEQHFPPTVVRELQSRLDQMGLALGTGVRDVPEDLEALQELKDLLGGQDEAVASEPD